MHDFQQYKFKPLNYECGLLCTLTFIIELMFILFGVIENFTPFVCFGIVFAIINVIMVILSIKKWNSFVYMDDEKITQYQFGKEITIYYDEIDYVKVGRSIILPSWPMLRIQKDGRTIIFDLNAGVRPFFEKCSNEGAKNDIKTFLEKNTILLPNIDFEYQQYKIRPCSGECGGACIGTFMLGFLLILCGITESIVQFIYIGIVFATINVIMVILSIKKWNSFVYMDDEKITQYQFGKEVTIYYDEIEYVRVVTFRMVKSFPKIKIHKDKKAITFDIHSGVRPFFKKCSNERVKNDIKVLLKKNYILLPNGDFD